ncbi:4a-hydroxytetrahydrobiopterin dehydratase [Streptomyces sp. XD-27]|uniref:4a-hydroxytetrahydrobiopterin dehydratase n=1 Tax=Streptomyces sp. XD-27 TaxID=3062779 RepID=UPI0026F45C7F|nr:4a-hydroxytetrahydrobiopterin dehydratase [Streptomyces sp. XD-27]WKX73272.1 4a-hydroxytetrahydrobiopterin dehydratase [Streptomyces sp. XD-27]
MTVEPLTDEEIEGRLRDLPGWSEQEDRLTRRYAFDGHLAAAGLVGQIARIQDELDHHSDVLLGYDTVTVSVNTHSVGGKITELDFTLAHRVEEAASAHPTLRR